MELAWVLSQLRTHMEVSERNYNGSPQAGVLIPFFEKDGEAHVLLVLRSSSLRKHSGQISFPGGKIESQDASIKETALRETQEEVGIPPSEVTVHFKFHDFSTPYYDSVTPIVASFSYPQPLKLSPVEVEEVLEVPIRHLMDPRIHHIEYWEYEGTTYTVHFFDYTQDEKKYNIWGATAGVLFKMLSVLRKAIQ